MNNRQIQLLSLLPYLVRSNLLTILHRTFLVFVNGKNFTSLHSDFASARLLEFYTDSSLRYLKTDQCTMGIGWIQTSTYGYIPIRTFSAQVCQFPSALRAEIYAVLSALCTAPPQCIVKIFSDNTQVLSGINCLLANSKLSPAQLQSYFPQNHLLWAAIHYHW